MDARKVGNHVTVRTSVRPYFRRPLHVSRCQMSHLPLALYCQLCRPYEDGLKVNWNTYDLSSVKRVTRKFHFKVVHKAVKERPKKERCRFKVVLCYKYVNESFAFSPG